MATTNVTIRMDTELKKQAEKLFSELGLSMTAALTVFLKQAVYEQGIPFDIRREQPNAETLAAIEAAEKGEDMYGPFNSVAEMMEALDA